MQVLPATAVMLEFRGTSAELADPATNVRLGIRYLGDAWFLAREYLCMALMTYSAGHGEDAMSGRSLDYCARVRAYLASVGSPLALELPPLPAPIARAPHGFHALVGSTRFWAAWARKVEARRTGPYGPASRQPGPACPRPGYMLRREADDWGCLGA